MSDVRCKISLSFLLLLLTISVAAQDVALQRGCRRGTPHPQSSILRRGGSEGKTPGGDFYHGERRQLVVMVAFADRSFKGDEAATLKQWNKIFNAVNLMEAPFKGSIHDYFYAQSYGTFNLVFDLQYVQVTGDAKKYRSWDISYGDVTEDDENSQYLVEDMMDVLKDRDIDWSLYDWNGDGYVNQVLIVYAGKGMNDGGGSNTIWPHQWWMSEHLKDRQDGVYCEPIPVTYGDKEYKVDCYCALAELTNKNDYGSFGTICHEYSHCFGFPDFYNGNTKFVAGWDLMDSGNYNSGGYCPPGYSAHERWLMGWCTPTELKSATEISNMQALCDEPQAYLIRNDGYDNEYYIVENRQRQGWDSSLPGSGLVVFHVDFDASIWVGIIEYPNSGSLKRYTIFPANNQSSVYSNAGWAYPYQTKDSLTNTSKPAATLNKANTDGSNLMNKSLYDMRVENGLASFRFATAPTTDIEELSAGQAYKILYDFGPMYIIRYTNGEIKKVMKH